MLPIYQFQERRPAGFSTFLESAGDSQSTRKKRNLFSIKKFQRIFLNAYKVVCLNGFLNSQVIYRFTLGFYQQTSLRNYSNVLVRLHEAFKKLCRRLRT